MAEAEEETLTLAATELYKTRFWLQLLIELMDIEPGETRVAIGTRHRQTDERRTLENICLQDTLNKLDDALGDTLGPDELDLITKLVEFSEG